MPSDNQQHQRRQAPTERLDKAAPFADRLVTIESQREFDLFSGQWAERVFVKMYVAARSSGLLATISDRDWKTLCTIATYMDSEGYCYPSQTELAKALGCSRQMANERIKSLAQFRFNGQSVLIVVKGERTGGRWSRNGYRVLPIANLAIFDGSEDSPRDSASDGPATSDRTNTENSPKTTVSRKLDTVKNESTVSTTVSSDTVTVQLDTNKIHRSNKKEQELSNNRKGSNAGEIVDNLEEQMEEGEIQASNDRQAYPGSHSGQRTGFRPVSELVATKNFRRQPQPASDEDREVIVEYIADFARELGDEAKLSASVTRAVNLYRQSSLTLGEFTGVLYQARSKTKEYTPNIKKRRQGDAYGIAPKNKMAYYFAILEDLLGLRDQTARPGQASRKSESGRSSTEPPRPQRSPNDRTDR